MSKDIFECDVPKGKGILCILGGGGDTKIFWNKKNKDEVENAKETFNNLVKVKKFAAFSVSKMGRKSKKITEFDPNIQKLIIIPPMAGGAIGGLMRGEDLVECSPPATQDYGMEKKVIQKNEEAEIKAMTLLEKKLGMERFIKFIAVGYIEIKGKYGLYKISIETVFLERNDKIGTKVRPLIYSLCVNVSKKVGYMPVADKILSLYLSITKDEEQFIQIANFRSVHTKDEFNERGETTLETLNQR